MLEAFERSALSFSPLAERPGAAGPAHEEAPVSGPLARFSRLTALVFLSGLPTGTTARPLLSDDHALLEDLTAPDSACLGALDRTGQAGPAERAPAASSLGQLDIGGQL